MVVMATAGYELCGEEEKSLFRANHKKYGRIKICNNCQDREASNFLSQAVVAVIKRGLSHGMRS